jgi:hypothetical protein
MTQHLFALLSLGALLTPLDARAGGEAEPKLTKEQCMVENERGQDARMSRHLSEAEVRFRACMAKSCPGPVREDCLRLLEEVRRATPSLVLVIKDSEGRLVSGATVTLDGTPVGSHQKGAVIRVDPGEHTFQVAAEGYMPATRKVVVEEGVSGHEESFVLLAPAPSPAATERRREVALTESTVPPRTHTQRTISYVVMGAGALGLGFGGVSTLLASGAHDDAMNACPIHICRPRSDGIEREHTAERWGNTANISVALGAALLVGGLVLFFTAPKGPSAAGAAWR